MKEIPEKFKEYLGRYQACLFDGYCGEPVSLGYPIVERLGPELWGEIHQYGTLQIGDHFKGDWYLVTKKLTPKEAVEKYGPIVEIVVGPRGGFRSVTYGKKKFIVKELDPRLSMPETAPKLVIRGEKFKRKSPNFPESPKWLVA